MTLTWDSKEWGNCISEDGFDWVDELRMIQASEMIYLFE